MTVSKGGYVDGDCRRTVKSVAYGPSLFFGGVRPVNFTDEPGRLVDAFMATNGVEW